MTNIQTCNFTGNVSAGLFKVFQTWWENSSSKNYLQNWAPAKHCEIFLYSEHKIQRQRQPEAGYLSLFTIIEALATLKHN